MKKIFYGIVCSVLLTGCERDFDIFIPNETQPVQAQTIDRFFDEARPPAVELQLDAAAGGILTLPSWGTLRLPPQALLTESGDSVSGPVTVTVREALRRGQWLSSRLPADAGGQLLQTAAAIQIRITQSNDLLRLADDHHITLQLPAHEAVQTPRLFQRPADSSPAVSWSLIADFPVTTSEVFDNDNQVTLPAYSVESDHLGWLLIGEYAQVTAATDLCVLLPAGHDPDNTTLYVVYEQRPMVCSLSWNENASGPRFCRNDLPADEPLTLVAISVTDDEVYYFQHRNFSLEGEIQLEWMDPGETTLPAILEFLSGL